VAFSRAVKDDERIHLDSPVERCCAACDAIHAQVCSDSYDE